MQICYIPATSNVVTLNLSETIQGAVTSAINASIIKPFHNWCYGVWGGFIDISLPACTIISLTSLMLYMIGVKKARQWIVIPIIVYLFLRIVDGMIVGGVA